MVDGEIVFIKICVGCKILKIFAHSVKTHENIKGLVNNEKLSSITSIICFRY